LYIAAVDADATTREMPITEWLWKPSAYVIITIPPMAKMAATICDQTEHCFNKVHHNKKENPQ